MRVVPSRWVHSEHSVRRRIVLATVAVLVVLAGTGTGPASSAPPQRQGSPTPVATRAIVALTPTPARTRGPTATPVPMPKADTFGRAGAPKPPIELSVPFVGGSWPVGVFVLENREGPSKKPDNKTVTVEMGVVNEANQPLLIAAAGQFKEA